MSPDFRPPTANARTRVTLVTPQAQEQDYDTVGGPWTVVANVAGVVMWLMWLCGYNQGFSCGDIFMPKTFRSDTSRLVNAGWAPALLDVRSMLENDLVSRILPIPDADRSRVSTSARVLGETASAAHDGVENKPRRLRVASAGAGAGARNEGVACVRRAMLETDCQILRRATTPSLRPGSGTGAGAEVGGQGNPRCGDVARQAGVIADSTYPPTSKLTPRIDAVLVAGRRRRIGSAMRPRRSSSGGNRRLDVPTHLQTNHAHIQIEHADRRGDADADQSRHAVGPPSTRGWRSSGTDTTWPPPTPRSSTEGVACRVVVGPQPMRWRGAGRGGGGRNVRARGLSSSIRDGGGRSAPVAVSVRREWRVSATRGRVQSVGPEQWSHHRRRSPPTPSSRARASPSPIVTTARRTPHTRRQSSTPHPALPTHPQTIFSIRAVMHGVSAISHRQINAYLFLTPRSCAVMHGPKLSRSDLIQWRRHPHPPSRILIPLAHPGQVSPRASEWRASILTTHQHGRRQKPSRNNLVPIFSTLASIDGNLQAHPTTRLLRLPGPTTQYRLSVEGHGAVMDIITLHAPRSKLPAPSPKPQTQPRTTSKLPYQATRCDAPPRRACSSSSTVRSRCAPCLKPQAPPPRPHHHSRGGTRTRTHLHGIIQNPESLIQPTRPLQATRFKSHLAPPNGHRVARVDPRARPTTQAHATPSQEIHGTSTALSRRQKPGLHGITSYTASAARFY
ncbi:hypothetical protein JB92DRAFT_2836444 [Gautieria morchelliformis]|nr:hypothetical protein JB92DRAFT_2836444 [Gautieria morchelliformis]